MDQHLVRKLTPDQYRTTAWSCGTTTQLWIEPYEADYADRDFLWRISSAAVEDEISTFTPLPDYDRFIAAIQGDIVLRHEGGEPLSLHPYDVHAFDGGASTLCTGRCRDFNLLLRKGRAEGTLEAVKLPSLPAFNGLAPLPAPPVLTLRPQAACEELLLFCAEGSASVTVVPPRSAGPFPASDVIISLSENEAMILQGKASSILVIGGGVLMLAQMWRTPGA
ncbi:MAG: HutD family protein [Lachnospiraceae bacterium]|nr:HutD family protein [Lachnospiraceae bacterium]